MGLLDLASDGSPLSVEPMFLFGWALCNTSTYCMLTFWLSCVNYALRGEFPFLHRLLQDIFTYALFWLPRVNLSLKNKLPYYTISFSWNRLLLEPKFLCDECSVNLYNFFLAKVTTLFLKWKHIFLFSNSPCRIRHYVESMQMLSHKAMENLCQSVIHCFNQVLCCFYARTIFFVSKMLCFH